MFFRHPQGWLHYDLFWRNRRGFLVCIGKTYPVHRQNPHLHQWHDGSFDSHHSDAGLESSGRSGLGILCNGCIAGILRRSLADSD